MERCEAAAAAGKSAYSCQAFCEMFAGAAERAGARRRLAHEPGAKACVGWAGDAASLTDRLTGARTEACVMVVALPCSDRFWAQGFADMRRRSRQEGRARALEGFGGVPRMLVPDNAATATDRSSACVAPVDDECRRFAERYGAAVVPAGVRRPRDKAVAGSAVGLVERWVIAPSDEMTFHSPEESDGFCLERARRPSARPFSAEEGSRDSVCEDEGRACMRPPPSERCEMCERRSCEAAPDHRVTVGCVSCSVPFHLIGGQVDVRLSGSRATVMSGGGAVAEHARPRGREGQCSTPVERMPPAHAAMGSPWSRERLSSRAHRMGAEAGEAVDRLLDGRPVVGQAFVPARDMLGLSRSCSPQPLERACAKSNALGAVPGCTALENAIIATRAADADGRAPGRTPGASDGGGLADRAKSAGGLRGADACRRGGGARC